VGEPVTERHSSVCCLQGGLLGSKAPGRSALPPTRQTMRGPLRSLRHGPFPGCLATDGGNLTCGPRPLVLPDGRVVDRGLALATAWSHAESGSTALPPAHGGFHRSQDNLNLEEKRATFSRHFLKTVRAGDFSSVCVCVCVCARACVCRPPYHLGQRFPTYRTQTDRHAHVAC
jgi:hypothetical protein